MDRRGVADRLRSALADAKALPGRDVDSIDSLINAGEFSIALETLCTQINEYDVEITSSERRRLEELGQALNVRVPFLLGDPWADPPSDGTQGRSNTSG